MIELKGKKVDGEKVDTLVYATLLSIYAPLTTTKDVDQCNSILSFAKSMCMATTIWLLTTCAEKDYPDFKSDMSEEETQMAAEIKELVSRALY